VDVEIPDRLLHNLANTPVVDEAHIDGVVASGWRVGNHRPLRSVPSERDLHVLLCASHGLTDRMVGEVLGLTENTVKTHVRSAIAVTRAKNKLHAVAICLRAGWLD